MVLQTSCGEHEGAARHENKNTDVHYAFLGMVMDDVENLIPVNILETNRSDKWEVAAWGPPVAGSHLSAPGCWGRPSRYPPPPFLSYVTESTMTNFRSPDWHSGICILLKSLY